MTAEGVFSDLYDKYGNDFNWRMLPFTDKSFTNELKREIGTKHFLYDTRVWAVAKCDSNDDVLYRSGSENKKDIYYIFHLTWQKFNENAFPRYIKIIGIDNVKAYIENSYISEYLLDVTGIC